MPTANEKTGVICQYYCAYKKFFFVTNPNSDSEVTKSLEEISKHVTLNDCKECFKIEIITGKLLCKANKEHNYEIKEGIPIMLTKEQKKELYGD